MGTTQLEWIVDALWIASSDASLFAADELHPDLANGAGTSEPTRNDPTEAGPMR